MIDGNHLHILLAILQDTCVGDKIIPRSVLFSKFESRTKSGMAIYKFKKALSFLINNGTISGYEIKPGRGGGVCLSSAQERISLNCSSGKFIGYISKQDLEKLISNLQRKESM